MFSPFAYSGVRARGGLSGTEEGWRQRPARRETYGRATRRLSRATSAHSEDQETVQQAHTAETSARETTGRATEAVGARDDRGDQPAE